MRKSPEADIQIQIIARLQDLGIFFHAVPNEGGGANKVRTMQLITTGLRPGTPDLVVWWPCHGSNAVQIGYIEVKVEKGIISPAQLRYHTRAHFAGVRCDVVRSLSDLEALIRNYCPWLAGLTKLENGSNMENGEYS